MKVIINEKGIALIVALITALLVLILGSIALYVSLKSTNVSGSFRQYRAAIQAAKGGYEKTKYIIDDIKVNNPDNISNVVNPTNFKDKLNNATADNTAVWTNNNSDAQNPDTTDSNPDITFNIGNYNVYVKLINTAKGNTAIGFSGKLNAGGVTTNKSGASIIHPPKVPYLYTLEIVSESKTTNKEADISTLYGY